MIYDLAILGGGPAGIAAGVYAARKKLRTVFIAQSIGGQSVESMGIENWIGTVKISGIDFAAALKNHLKAYSENVVDLKLGERVKVIQKNDEVFEIHSESGKSLLAKTVLIATGSHRRKLDIPGSKEFENKGITYCASCDGPLFADKDVVVIGGGNAGFESAAQLLAYSKSVTLLNRSENLKADPVTVEKLKSHPKFKLILNAVPVEIKGNELVSSIRYRNAKNNETVEIPTEGIFVEIGNIPTTNFAQKLVEMDQFNRIIVDPKNQRAKMIGENPHGIWAAGDCTDGLYHQNNIAAGDAIKALEDIYLYLHTK